MAALRSLVRTTLGFALALAAVACSGPTPKSGIEPAGDPTVEPDRATASAEPTVVAGGSVAAADREAYRLLSEADELLVVAGDRVDQGAAKGGVRVRGGRGGGVAGRPVAPDRAAGDRRAQLAPRGRTRAAKPAASAPPPSKRPMATLRRSRKKGNARPQAPAIVPPTEGVLRVQGADGAAEAVFPLTHTAVRAEVAGWLASTDVTQTFDNPFREAVEAVYVFPLPTSAAINHFVMEIEGRRIVGIIRPRAEAERIYAEARARGQTASLLSQERTNIFTQSVANIEPGGRVDIHITYFHQLDYRQGAFEYVFPMVVGPRYMPGGASPSVAGPADQRAAGGGGVSPDTNQVRDASRISPPTLPPGMRSGHDVSLAIEIEAGVRIERVESPSHEIAVTRASDAQAAVELSDKRHIPNKDFVLRWHVAGSDLRPGVVVHRDDQGTQGGFFSAFLVPQLDPGDADVTPREITFVVDTSGSMRGVPIESCKRVLRKAIGGLRGYDRFNVIRFAGGSGSLFEAPKDATPESVEAGLAYIESFKGGGGTEMLAGIRAWMAQPTDPRYMRLVCFLTDGYVGNEAAIHQIIANEGSDARWFAFGIGSSVNRLLVEGIAEHGNGVAEVVLPREEGAAERAADRFFSRIDAPVLVDVEVVSVGLELADVYPKRVPDLFTGEPIRVTGRYTQPGAGQLLFRGRVGSRQVEIPIDVDLPASELGNVALPSVWARSRIHDLSKRMLLSSDDKKPELAKEITELAVEFRLVSQFTSFVAVDESRIVSDGKPLRILQPVELPEGVSYEGAVGTPPGRLALRVAAWGVLLVETKDGALAVVSVDKGSAADRAGVTRGQVVQAFAGHQLRSAHHLESLVLQTSAERVEVGVRPGRDPAAAVTRIELPRP